MKRLLFILLMLLSVNSSFAYWSVTVEEDLFSGGNSAMLFGDIGSTTIVVDCNSKGYLSLSYLENNSEKKIEGSYKAALDLAIKIDQNNVIITKGDIGRRNQNYLELKTNDRKFIIDFLSQLKKAKSKITLSLKSELGQENMSGNVLNSTKSVNQLASACKLKLN